jgi:predicted metal-dependent peptidase
MQKLTNARGALIQGHPFFGALAFRLQLIEDAGVDTLHLVGDQLRVNPAYLDANRPAQLQGVLASTVLKPALAHPMRRGTRDERRWVEASHFVTNGIVAAAGMELPDGAPLSAEFAGLSVEEVYARLAAQQPPQSGGAGDQSGDGGEESDAGGKGGDADGKGQEGGGDDAGDNENAQADDGGAQGAGGAARDVGNCGSFADQPGTDGGMASPAELAQAEQEWKIAAVQAANSARTMGQLPGNVAEMVAVLKQPRVSWRDELRAFMTRNTKSAHDWCRPDRRFIGRKLYLPSLNDPAMDCVAIVVDTSASVSRDELAAFTAEINAVLEDTRPARVVVIQCDTRVNGVDEYTPDNLPVILEYKGRGGTFLRPAFEEIDARQLDPDCILCLSDLEFGAAELQPWRPDAPMLWVSVQRQHEPMPYGDVVYLDLSA